MKKNKAKVNKDFYRSTNKKFLYNNQSIRYKFRLTTQAK